MELNKASEISGFTNESLKYARNFDTKVGQLISNFFETLRSGDNFVCLIAHNGQKFDDPILREYLKKSKV